MGLGDENNLFMSIMEDEKSSPTNLLWVICCSCKEFCDKRCAYRKAGIVQVVETFEIVQRVPRELLIEFYKQTF